MQPVLRSESVGIAHGRGTRAARNAEYLVGASRGPITFPNLLQFLVFLHRGSGRDPGGPSVLIFGSQRCKGGGTPASGPAPSSAPAAQGLLGLVVLEQPGFPVMPEALD